MRKTNNGAVLDASAAHFPEHGPIAENGKEILLSVRNVDINFGKGESQVKAVKNASFDVYRGRRSPGSESPAQARRPLAGL